MSALWMPKGSVRAILIIMLTWTACLMLSTHTAVPKELWSLVQMGVAFYIGMKVNQNKEEK